MKILSPNGEPKTEIRQQDPNEQYKSLCERAKRSARIATVLWVMALFMPLNFHSEYIPGAGILLGTLMMLNGTHRFSEFMIGVFPFVGQLCLFSLCLMRQSKPYNKPVFIGDIFIWIGGTIGLMILATSVMIWFWLASAFFVTRAGLLYREAFQLSQSGAIQAAADNSNRQTAGAPENDFRQPETTQPISAETAHLSDAETAQYKSLSERAKRCARIAAVLWVIALFMPSSSHFSHENELGIEMLTFMFNQLFSPILIPASFPTIGQICLIFLMIRRMGEPYKPNFIGDVFVWIGCIIVLRFLFDSVVIWFWLASAFFVTRAGLLHRKIFQLFQSDAVQTAADNSDSVTGTQDAKAQSRVQAAVDNVGTETAADAEHSDSPAQTNRQNHP